MNATKVVVVDMQPITPAVGGGRQRLLGLYHNLGEHIDTVYVGTYDWPGESFRDHRPMPGLREICVPLSAAHHAAAKASAERMDGRVVIDIEFADQATLSPEYLAVARREIALADVVVFSHPWCYPPLRDALRADQMLVYDSQNVEAVLRTSLHDDLPQAVELLDRVAQIEYELCRDADLVLTCSHEDRELFHRIFGVEWHRLRVMPNGIFAFAQHVPTPDERIATRYELDLGDAPLAVFLGSDYGPNNAAARMLVEDVAPALPEVQFALLGSCCQVVEGMDKTSNCHLIGVVDDDTKRRWMRSANMALNPLAQGSGTSIKMFDYMAAGLPTIATVVGARGIVSTGKVPYVLTELNQVIEAVQQIAVASDRATLIGKSARQIVEKFYAWERISPMLGLLFHKVSRERISRRSKPYFSVVIPTYQRHQLLDTLVNKLKYQRVDNFEVIVVDQSKDPWPGASDDYGFPITYVHSEVKGAVNARNIGGLLASGEVIAFTDDDCEPLPDWLSNAIDYFRDPEVVGVEGLIRSDHLDDPRWRSVTNVGFEGIGFMTANLLVRNEVFQALNGFDLAFDEPHFREDTDFGWRMQSLGKVPYAPDVEVYHPAHRRDVVRESQAERNRFFEKDALLLKKHPERYQTLFFAEGHFCMTPGFWEHVERGLDTYQMIMPEWMAEAARCEHE